MESSRVRSDDILQIAQQALFHGSSGKLYYKEKEYHCKVVFSRRYILIHDFNKCIIEYCSSLTDYLKRVFSLKKDHAGINIYYRGQASHYSWIPSLYRNDAWVKKEYEMNMKVLSKHVTEFINCHTTIEKLIKLKHYNQPSRLLDIVENPLMALYFACESSKRENSSGMVAAFFQNLQKKSIPSKATR